MKEYTHDEWLRKPYFKYSNPDLLEAGSHTLEDRDLDELIKNDPVALWHQGLISDVEFDKIETTKKEVFKIVVQNYRDQTPAFIESYIRDNPDKEFILNERLDSIDKHFSKPFHKQDLKWIIADLYPSINLPGIICNKIIEDKTIAPYLSWFYSSQIDLEIPSILPHKINNAYPHHFLLNSVLFEERRVISQKQNQFKLSPELILETYIEKKRSLTESDAFDFVVEWLTEELNYTEKQVKEEFGITLTFGALKKRAHRYVKSQQNK